MPAIEVTNLQKIFQTKRKAAGMSGSVRSLLSPEYSSIEAVRKLRRTMVDLNPVEAMETLLAALRKHKTNDELLAKLL